MSGRRPRRRDRTRILTADTAIEEPVQVAVEAPVEAVPEEAVTAPVEVPVESAAVEEQDVEVPTVSLVFFMKKLY